MDGRGEKPKQNLSEKRGGKLAVASRRVSIIGRSNQKSAVAAAAYRSGERFYDEENKKYCDYTKRRDVIYSEILAPTNAPEWVYERPTLWNTAQNIESRCDARFAREMMIALPKELTPEQGIVLARTLTQELVDKGMIADLCIHDDKKRNCHAHIMVTLRTIDENGFGKKNRDWDKKQVLVEWYQHYQDKTNQTLERFGHPERIDIRSYKEQGIEQLPTIHLGQKSHQQEQRGIQTIRGDHNRKIEAYNRELEDLKQQLESEKYRQEIERLKAENQEKERGRERIKRDSTNRFKIELLPEETPEPYHEINFEERYRRPLEIEEKIAGQGKEMKGETANGFKIELLPEETPEPYHEINFEDRYKRPLEIEEKIAGQGKEMKGDSANGFKIELLPEETPEPYHEVDFEERYKAELAEICKESTEYEERKRQRKYERAPEKTIHQQYAVRKLEERYNQLPHHKRQHQERTPELQPEPHHEVDFEDRYKLPQTPEPEKAQEQQNKDSSKTRNQ